MAASRCGNVLLPTELCPAVDSCRIGRLILPAWGVVQVSSEHIVRRDMYHEASVLLYGIGDISRGLRIEEVRNGSIVLGPVHIRIRGAVDDHVNLFRNGPSSRHGVFHRFPVCYVEMHRLRSLHFIHIGEYVSVPASL